MSWDVKKSVWTMSAECKCAEDVIAMKKYWDTRYNAEFKAMDTTGLMKGFVRKFINRAILHAIAAVRSTNTAKAL